MTTRFLVFLSNLLFCEHKPLFIPIKLCFMKMHVWRVSYFFIKRLTKIETSSTFLNSHQKILENFRKFRFSYFHLENSRTWIFTLWNHILQTQTSLLQPILVYTYIYNSVISLSLHTLGWLFLCRPIDKLVDTSHSWSWCRVGLPSLIWCVS